MIHPNDKYRAHFTDEGYAVMRHAESMEAEPKLWPRSVKICELVVADFTETISKRPVAIFHSPLHRAVVTAKFVSDELGRQGVRVTKMTACDWLKDESFQLNNENISAARRDIDGAFALIIGHYPDIKSFLGEKRRAVEIPEAFNCTIFAQRWLIPGKRD